MHPPLDPLALEHFNAGRYRDALLAFEEQWHSERSELLKALINLSNAMLQLQIGLVTAPRRNLARAVDMLTTCSPAVAAAAGVDLPRLHAAIARVQACIPPDAVSGADQFDPARIPPIQIRTGNDDHTG